jgi:K+-sensing histidine kinase KdpD
VLIRLQRPVQSLIKGLSLLRFEEKGPISKENYGQEIEAMHEAALMLAHFASPFLRIEQVNMTELIEKCAVIIRKDALKARLQISYEVPQDLPLIWADRVRMRQVICSVVYQSLLYLPPFRECKIKLSQELDGQGTRTLCIVVEDNGLGFNNMARENARNPYLVKQADYDVLRLDLPIVQYFLYQHQGSLEIDTKCGTGSRWVIRIPYSEKEALEQLEKDPTSKMAGLRAIEEFQAKSQKVIQLPSRKSRPLSDREES